MLMILCSKKNNFLVSDLEEGAAERKIPHFFLMVEAFNQQEKSVEKIEKQIVCFA